VKLLVVGGGGGGGAAGSGGGAGGYVYNPSFALSTGSYPITVGAGGAGGTGHGVTAAGGANGGNSTFSTVTANGGGGGIPLGDGGYPGGTTASSGGSGGGGTMLTAGNTPSGGVSIGNQGNNGGAGFVAASWSGGMGGGGGAGGPGNAGSNSTAGGNGGLGVLNTITGSSVYYAGGGGGGEINGNFVGGSYLGGGGWGHMDAAGTNGVANTGGGGGGGSYNGSYFNGGNGGSGIVVISYPTGSMTTDAANRTGETVTTSGGNTIVTFTSAFSGSFNVSAINTNKTIPNNGYVQLLRDSNGSVWRTYTQPASPAASVPDLCSGTANSSLGWNNATYSSSAGLGAQITLATGNLNPGPMYYRKDFSVATAGSYNLAAAADDLASISIDGTVVLNVGLATSSTSVNLTAGCHTVLAQVTNGGVAANPSGLSLTLTNSSSSLPIMGTDTSWRVSAGNTVHYSMPGYYEDPNQWDPVRVFGLWANAQNPWAGAPAAWGTTSGDTFTSYIGNTNAASGNNYPGSSYTWFRNTQGFTLASQTDVKFSTNCDDSCSIYLDGTAIFTNTGGQVLTTTTVTVGPGKHNVGIQLFNGATAVNPSGLLFAAVQVSNGTVLMRSDASWDSTVFWNQVPTDYYSYDTGFSSNPALPSANIKALVVAGGGGGGGSTGGGGGAGGLLYNSSLAIRPGTYTVTVGAGGNGGPNQAQGTNGGNSIFDGMIAIGGGAGGYSYNSTAGNNGLSGGSGGGGESYYGSYQSETGIPGQGNTGGMPLGTASGAGGGGAGGNGAGGVGTNVGGAGGIGVTNSITGSSVYYAGGGGGSQNGAGGSGGGGAGANATTTNIGTTGTPNTGGGGGGGWAYAGGLGGAGGSGVVIISYPTGSMTTTNTGGVVTTSGGNTIITFNGSGTFTILSIP